MSELPGFIETGRLAVEYATVNAVLLDGVMHARRIYGATEDRVLYVLNCYVQLIHDHTLHCPKFFTGEVPITCLTCLALPIKWKGKAP